MKKAQLMTPVALPPGRKLKDTPKAQRFPKVRGHKPRKV